MFAHNVWLGHKCAKFPRHHLAVATVVAAATSTLVTSESVIFSRKSYHIFCRMFSVIWSSLSSATASTTSSTTTLSLSVSEKVIVSQYSLGRVHCAAAQYECFSCWNCPLLCIPATLSIHREAISPSSVDIVFINKVSHPMRICVHIVACLASAALAGLLYAITYISWRFFPPLVRFSFASRSSQ